MSIPKLPHALLAVLALAGGAARAETVVVVSPSHPASALTVEQVANVYLGRSTEFTPVDQAEGSALRTEFYGKVTGKDASQIRAIWSKLAFTGKGTPPRELAGSAEVKKAVAAGKNTIGYIEKSAVDGSVKVILSVP